MMPGNIIKKRLIWSQDTVALPHPDIPPPQHNDRDVIMIDGSAKSGNAIENLLLDHGNFIFPPAIRYFYQLIITKLFMPSI